MRLVGDLPQAPLRRKNCTVFSATARRPALKSLDDYSRPLEIVFREVCCIKIKKNNLYQYDFLDLTYDILEKKENQKQNNLDKERTKMFRHFKKKRIEKYVEDAAAYLQINYKKPLPFDGMRFSIEDDDEIPQEQTPQKDSGIRYSKKPQPQQQPNDSGIRYSKKPQPQLQPDDSSPRYSVEDPAQSTADRYCASEVTRIIRSCSNERNVPEMLKNLERNVNLTFVDKLLHFIRMKGLRDSEVYKAAHVDKRLFSKLASNREYKPSKDTAVALALALKLSLDEANDLISRAGYTFSHSNKRDVIIEFFFREKVYNLMDANEVLYKLDQKLIGRE